jgi:hypothetical protein
MVLFEVAGHAAIVVGSVAGEQNFPESSPTRQAALHSLGTTGPDLVYRAA